MRLWLALIAFLLLVTPAHALSFEESSDGHSNKTIQDYIADFVDVPKGGTNWKVFGTTKEIPIETKTEDGYDLVYSKPDFQPEVKALDGKEIKIKGYMFPLDGTEDQKNFLFGPFPLSCPFQYHVGPPLVIEVHADNNPVTFDYEPVVITGTLELVPDDPEYSVFYRLKDARQVK
ncbi:MAG: DUF3299 domain-containing protein [Rhodospirillales bacterium]|nr:DUF3299 domain-containing protein [Rhodospirillales bacterium]